MIFCGRKFQPDLFHLKLYMDKGEIIDFFDGHVLNHLNNKIEKYILNLAYKSI